MERWDGKVAVVTGASSGVGKAISQCLVSHGISVVAVSRRRAVLEKLADEQKGKKGKLYPRAVDVTNEEEVVTLFESINKKLGGVHILVNCAGAGDFVNSSLTDGKPEGWKAFLQSQLIGLSLCTREAVRSMKRAVNDGVIIHINSVGGHYIPNKAPPMLVAAKHGITVLTEMLRRELTEQKLHIKVTSLSPGVIKTEKVAAIPEFKNKPLLELQDVCSTVEFILSAPPHLEISELTFRAHLSGY